MIAKLKYNENDMCYECSICGGRYGEEELKRLTDYNDEFKITQDGFCMDCGAYWENN